MSSWTTLSCRAVQSSRKRAWLTPDVEDALAETICKRFFIPDTEAFRQSVSGALLELTHSWNWEQHGTMTPETAALVMLEMYNEYALSSGCEAGSGNAPFWSDEEADDADDQEPPQPTFEWYEDVADWIVTAFLAVSFTPDAAIQFVTTARQIRFFFRKRDYGGIFRVLWDEVVVGEVDTYSATPDVGWFDFFAQSASEHVLRIEHTGENNPSAAPLANGYAIEIVRGRLRFEGLQLRRNTTTGEVEISLDDGATWQPSPENDPTLQPPRLPPRTGIEARCDAAANLTAYIKAYMDATIVAMNFTASAATLVSILFEFLRKFIGFWGLVLAIAEALVAALLAAGASVIENAFDDPFYDRLQCYFFCYMDENGVLTEAGKFGVEEDIFANEATATYDIMRLFFAASGAGVLTDIATEGTLEGDCVGCDQCGWCWDFLWTTAGQDGWVNFTQPTYTPRSAFVAGEGFVGAYYSAIATRYNQIQITGFAPTYVKEFSVWSNRASFGVNRFQVRKNDVNGTGLSGSGSNPKVDGSLYRWDFVVDDTITGIWLTGDMGYGVGNQSVIFTKARLQGLGDNPFGESNCEGDA